MKRIPFIAVAAFCLISCEKEVSLPLQIIEPSVKTIFGPACEAEYKIDVNSNTSWTVDISSASWLGSDVCDTIGVASVRISIDANDSEERTAEVVFRSIDGAVSRAVTVRQSGKDGSGTRVSTIREKEAKESVILSEGTLKVYLEDDYPSGNSDSKYAHVEDDFSDPLSGICLYSKDGFSSFTQGDNLEVNLEGAVLRRDPDRGLILEIVGRPATSDMTHATIRPRKVSISELKSGRFESMYVCIDSVQVTESYIGGVISENPTFENRAHETASVFAEENSSFAQLNFDKGVGSISGIAGPLAEGDVSVSPTRSEDIAFGPLRFDVKPGISELPYVFSFYSEDGTTPKYIKYTYVTWNSSSWMQQGTIAEDADKTLAGSLYISAYSTAKGKTVDQKGGTNYAVEPAARDYVEAAGFISVDSPTNIPPKECHVIFSVPVQKTLPEKFNVIFGFAGNNYTIGNWKILYSKDGSHWTEAGSVSFNGIVDNSNNYFYRSVTISPVYSFDKGDMLYIKFLPFKTIGFNPKKTAADGHGSSCFLRIHSAIILTSAVPGLTEKPSQAVWFESFDNLTEGADFLCGAKNGALANFSGKDISSWSSNQKNGMSGTGVRERPGYAQIGYVSDETVPHTSIVNNVGSLTSPEIGKAGDYYLSFKACAYRSPAIRTGSSSTILDVANPDITTGIIRINGGGTIDGKSEISIDNLPTNYAMRRFNYRITGATASTTVTFTSKPAAGEFSRWFIDEISITR